MYGVMDRPSRRHTDWKIGELSCIDERDRKLSSEILVPLHSITCFHLPWDRTHGSALHKIQHIFVGPHKQLR